MNLLMVAIVSAIALYAILFPNVAYSATPSAATTVNRVVSEIKRHPSLDIVFSVWNNGNSSSGSMSVAGKYFFLSTPEIKIWYDGKTQWSYLHSAGEVNITEPDATELAQSNPLSILAGIEKNFTFRRLQAPAGTEKIELTPKKKSADFVSAILTINSATNLPKELQIKDSKGRSTIVKISSIKGGKTKPAAAFRFPASKYPGVEVVDLR